jgi:RNA polymerase sigma-70 factor, ECF subfamily
MSGVSLVLEQLLVEDDSERLPPSAVADQQRLRGLVEAHHAFLWRSLRRLGVATAEVDDAAQQAWLVVARKLTTIAPGAERAFVFAVALRVAAAHRRAVARHDLTDLDAAIEDPSPRADELLDRERARRVMDRILDGMPLQIRAVFVLYEVEEMTTPEIAAILAIPLGTVASRLRRARAVFEEKLARYHAQGGSR